MMDGRAVGRRQRKYLPLSLWRPPNPPKPPFTWGSMIRNERQWEGPLFRNDEVIVPGMIAYLGYVELIQGFTWPWQASHRDVCVLVCLCGVLLGKNERRFGAVWRAFTMYAEREKTVCRKVNTAPSREKKKTRRQDVLSRSLFKRLRKTMNWPDAEVQKS